MSEYAAIFRHLRLSGSATLPLMAIQSVLLGYKDINGNNALWYGNGRSLARKNRLQVEIRPEPHGISKPLSDYFTVRFDPRNRLKTVFIYNNQCTMIKNYLQLPVWTSEIMSKNFTVQAPALAGTMRVNRYNIEMTVLFIPGMHHALEGTAKLSLLKTRSN